ncbi:MAG: tRNA (adenosine(37)-N6)-threonylcarbamoyltransferase complex dimerization subunit type 1 TsaB [Salinibacter sp.]
MTLLALETATEVCGVALLQDDTIAAQAHLHRPRIHAARLTPLIEDVLEHAAADRGSLDAVAVSMGPGSYTGLRIGVSTAKGWAQSTGAALIGVPTLDAYAARLQPVAAPGDVVVALLDARRDEVYAGAYRCRPDGVAPHADTTALPVGELLDWLGAVEGRLWVVGDGGAKSREALSGADAPVTVLAPADVPPSAAWVGRRGHARLAAHGPDDRASFEPLYVKDVHATPAPSPFA